MCQSGEMTEIINNNKNLNYYHAFVSFQKRFYFLVFLDTWKYAVPMFLKCFFF